MTDYEEKELFEKVFEYSEEYFTEFRFEEGSITYDYSRVSLLEKNDDGEYVDTGFEESEKPEILEYFNAVVLKSYRYKVEPMDCYGQVNFKELTFTVNPESLNDKATVLHELIHVYEHVYEDMPSFYRDIVMLALYNDLKGKISDIDDRILAHTHILHGNDITIAGGEHNILFFLKSLDLDLKCGYKPGTVCGYGRDRDM